MKRWYPLYLKYIDEIEEYNKKKGRLEQLIEAEKNDILDESLLRESKMLFNIKPPKKPNLFLCTLKGLMSGRVIFAVFSQGIGAVFQLIMPRLMQSVLEVVSLKGLHDSNPIEYSDAVSFPYVYGIILILCPFLNNLFDGLAFRLYYHSFAQARAALSAIVFDKVLHLNITAHSNVNTGRLLSLISTDSRLISEVAPSILMILWMPVQVLLPFVFCLTTLKWYSFVTVGVVVVVVPIQLSLSNRMSHYMQQYMNFNDERNKVTNEVINGIRIIKFSGLEDVFREKVLVPRTPQVRWAMLFVFFQQLIYAFMRSFALVTNVVTFSAFIAGTKLEQKDFSKIIIPVIGYMQWMVFPTSVLAMSFQSITITMVCFTRLRNFLLVRENTRGRDFLLSSTSSSSRSSSSAFSTSSVSFSAQQPYALYVSHMSFEWGAAPAMHASNLEKLQQKKAQKEEERRLREEERRLREEGKKKKQGKLGQAQAPAQTQGHKQGQEGEGRRSGVCGEESKKDRDGKEEGNSGRKLAYRNSCTSPTEGLMSSLLSSVSPLAAISPMESLSSFVSASSNNTTTAPISSSSSSSSSSVSASQVSSSSSSSSSSPSSASSSSSSSAVPAVSAFVPVHFWTIEDDDDGAEIDESTFISDMSNGLQRKQPLPTQSTILSVNPRFPPASSAHTHHTRRKRHIHFSSSSSSSSSSPSPTSPFSHSPISPSTDDKPSPADNKDTTHTHPHAKTHTHTHAHAHTHKQRHTHTHHTHKKHTARKHKSKKDEGRPSVLMLPDIVFSDHHPESFTVTLHPHPDLSPVSGIFGSELSPIPDRSPLTVFTDSVSSSSLPSGSTSTSFSSSSTPNSTAISAALLPPSTAHAPAPYTRTGDYGAGGSSEGADDDNHNYPTHRRSPFSSSSPFSGRSHSPMVSTSPFSNSSRNGVSAAMAHGLHDICLEIPHGSLVMVIGPVGSGKSSLASAFIGEIDRKKSMDGDGEEGEMAVNGRIAYCPQVPWITNNTVRGNILFNSEYDEEKYRRVVRVCALETDFAIMAAGDETAIGEKGVNLSGGQKARIQLARAVYSDRDIFILDDPLSAVDAHVGKHLFEQCVCGELKKKTRLLMTNQLQFLKHADHIVILEEGHIVAQGGYAELEERGIDFEQYVVKGEDDAEKEKEKERKDAERMLAEKEKGKKEKVREKDEEENEERGRNEEDNKKRGKETAKQLLTEEEQETGTISLWVYVNYIRTLMHPALWLPYFSLHFLGESCWSFSQYWLGKIGNPYSFSAVSFWWKIRMYAFLSVMVFVFLFTRSICTAFAVRHSNTVVHNRLLDRVMKCPVSFYDTTPLGRVLNRFTGDVSKTDLNLHVIFNELINLWVGAIEQVVIVAIDTPMFLAIGIPTLLIFYVFLVIYSRTSRNLQRIESISRSPVLSTLSETVTGAGLSTIRAYGLEERWKQKFFDHGDAWTSRFVLFREGQKFAAVYSAVLSSVFMAGAVLAGWFFMSTDLMAVAINASMTFSWRLMTICQQDLENESRFTSYERVRHYCENIPQETSLVKYTPPDNWPDEGKVAFDHVSFRYRPGLPFVLNDVSFSLKKGEKLGVCGRTGAGKSSLLYALFRLVELDPALMPAMIDTDTGFVLPPDEQKRRFAEAPNRGRVLIDDVDISTVSLHRLRSSVAIIPQDPTLFTGTLRSNLDLLKRHPDQHIWEVLDMIEMRQAITDLPDGLDTQVAEGGSNFSCGQRQLLCFARAILNDARVVIMDEATANVDVETDEKIQATIRTQFKAQTVFVIAHRLHTIINSDRILVMDGGKVAEFDSPKRLMQNPDSLFNGLLRSVNE